MYSDFKKPVVAIYTTHSSIEYPNKNKEFYKMLLKSLYEGGYKHYPEYDYAIINGIDITDVGKEL